MKKNLTPLGHARVYRHPATGQLVVDTDSLRRTHFAGADFAGGPDPDELEPDDFEGYDEDDEFEGYDDEEDDFGFFRRNPERRRRRRMRRLQRRRDRLERRMGRKVGRIERKERKLEEKGADGLPTGWGATAVSDSENIDRAQGGSASLKIPLQHDFRAQDIAFTGSAPGALVHSIFFGDRAVWSSSDGIDAGVFAANGFMRGLLKGQSLEAGLDIIVNGSLPGPGRFTATLILQELLASERAKWVAVDAELDAVAGRPDLDLVPIVAVPDPCPLLGVGQLPLFRSHVRAAGGLGHELAVDPDAHASVEGGGVLLDIEVVAVRILPFELDGEQPLRDVAPHGPARTNQPPTISSARPASSKHRRAHASYAG